MSKISLIRGTCIVIWIVGWCALVHCWAADKLDPPSADEQAAARRTIAEIYKSDYDKAKMPVARAALAKKLIDVGSETKDDPAAQFVLWRIAKDIAVRAADYDLAATALSKIDDRFSVDALSMKIEALESVVAAPEAVPDYKKLAPPADLLLEEAISCERFDLADRACAKEIDFYQKLGDANAIAHARARQQDLTKIEAAFELVAGAQKVLQAEPLNAAANTSIGQFRCFVKNDWVKGLPMLALSDNELLMRIAKRDLGAQEDPTSQLALADDWWNLAETEKDQVQAAMRVRSAYWYQKAIPKLSGLSKEKAEKRAASVNSTVQQPTADGGNPTPVSNDDKKPEIKPSSPAALAASVEHQAQQCHRAKDALLVYKLFLADNKVPEEAKVHARKQIGALDDAAAKDYYRLGPKWVSREEVQAAKENAESSVRQALDLLAANNVKEAKESLEKASRTDPNAPRADFMLGILYALKRRDFIDARAHFMECVRREPQDVCTLNNLALVEIMLNNDESALSYLREAIKVDPTAPELAHNVRKVLAECGSKNLTLPATIETAFSELYGNLIKSGSVEERTSKGWQYMPPIVARIDFSEDDPKSAVPDDPSPAPKTDPAPSDGNKNQQPSPQKSRHPSAPKSNPGFDWSVISAGGSGFVVYPHYVLTNRHVIEGSTQIFVRDPTDSTSKKMVTAHVVAQSRDPDLAILRCDELDAPPIGISPHLPGRGTDIMVLGFPEFDRIGTGLKSTRGSIVGLPNDETEGMCLYDAVSNHGNSGGPICDNTGRVIAVVRVIFNLTEMLNGGIPSEQLVPFLNAHIPGFKPLEGGEKVLDWPSVDALVSKSTVLVLCRSAREPQLTIPDGDESALQGAQSASTNSKKRSSGVKPQQTYIEDDVCLACRGTGKARCPDCQNGTISKTEKVLKFAEPVTGTSVYTDKKIRVPCKNCHGTGQVPCPVCAGSGIEGGM